MVNTTREHLLNPAPLFFRLLSSLPLSSYLLSSSASPPLPINLPTSPSLYFISVNSLSTMRSTRHTIHHAPCSSMPSAPLMTWSASSRSANDSNVANYCSSGVIAHVLQRRRLWIRVRLRRDGNNKPPFFNKKMH